MVGIATKWLNEMLNIYTIDLGIVKYTMNITHVENK
jgi:hypothetical protein